VIQEVGPFMSAEDIAAGARWQYLVAEALEGSSFGILCVTRENQSAPWLNFEAGAITKQVDSSRVVPLAIDLSPADVKPPLGHFQAKEMSKVGILAVLESINELCVRPLTDVTKLHDVWWPELEPRLEAARSSADTPESVRSERDLLEELIAIVRGLQAQAVGLPIAPQPLTWPTIRERLGETARFTNVRELTSMMKTLLPDDARVFSTIQDGQLRLRAITECCGRR